jgi:WhiB family redox-sensing transcriptional regulator
MWWDEAACVGKEKLFFSGEPLGRPAKGQVSTRSRQREVCLGCPVRDDCLRDAMAFESGRAQSYRWGMWGGLSPNERYDLEFNVK